MEKVEMTTVLFIVSVFCFIIGTALGNSYGYQKGFEKGFDKVVSLTYYSVYKK